MSFLKILALVIFVCAFGAIPAPAATTGPTEFCPAEISGQNRLEAADRALYSFALDAQSARTVSGDILADTNAGWFSIPFSNVALTADGGSYKNDYVAFSRNNFLSNELFVAFPPAVTKINGLWVDKAQATGDAFGWEAKGSVTCLPPAGTGIDLPTPKHVNAPGTDVKRVSPDPLDLTKPPSASDTILKAQPAAGIAAACAAPASFARVRYAVQPRWPRGWTVNRTVKTAVEVAVSAEGKLEGAWIYQPSGTDALDEAALAAAEASSYAAGSAYCAPAPGLYLFTALFITR